MTETGGNRTEEKAAILAPFTFLCSMAVDGPFFCGADYSKIIDRGESAVFGQTPEGTSLRKRMDRCGHRGVGRRALGRCGCLVRSTGQQIEQVRNRDGTPLRHKCGSDVRLSGTRSGHLRSFVFVRMRLERVPQRMQVRPQSKSAKISPQRPVGGGNSCNHFERVHSLFIWPCRKLPSSTT